MTVAVWKQVSEATRRRESRMDRTFLRQVRRAGASQPQVRSPESINDETHLFTTAGKSSRRGRMDSSSVSASAGRPLELFVHRRREGEE